jgi:hypothetical protein
VLVRQVPSLFPPGGDPTSHLRRPCHVATVAEMATTPEQRLDWAHRHVQRLRAEAAQYLKTVRPSEKETATTIGGVTALIGLMAGDAIHNLRASLDNLIVDLAPPAAQSQDPNFLAFPIRATLAAFNKAANKSLAGVDPTLIDAVRLVQPFVTPQAGGLPGDGGRLLALLNDFWNDDKHRIPVVGVAVAGGSIPATGFQGFIADLARRYGTEVHFRPHRSSDTATINDLNRIHSLLMSEVVPRLRAAV